MKTQIKLFNCQTPNLEEIEKKVNIFLHNKADKIQVVDIKYTAEHSNPGNPIWVEWTVMVIYTPL